MNPIRKTQALALRIHPYSKTSHVINWLTPDQGLVVTVAKGALRPRSAFLGKYDLFYTCELLYYGRDRNGIHVARECAPLQPRSFLRHRWRAYATASYAADLLLRIAPPGSRDPELFQLAGAFMDALGGPADPGEACLRFESRCLAVSGFAPRMDRCAHCGLSVSESGPTQAKWSLVAGRGAVLCPACGPPPEPSEWQALGRSSLLRIAGWQAAPGFTPETNPPGRNELLEIRRSIGMLVELYLHAAPACRKLAYELSSVRAVRYAPTETA